MRTGDKRAAKADELILKPLELINRFPATVPPPRTHQHRYISCQSQTRHCALR